MFESEFKQGETVQRRTDSLFGRRKRIFNNSLFTFITIREFVLIDNFVLFCIYFMKDIFSVFLLSFVLHIKKAEANSIVDCSAISIINLYVINSDFFFFSLKNVLFKELSFLLNAIYGPSFGNTKQEFEKGGNLMLRVILNHHGILRIPRILKLLAIILFFLVLFGFIIHMVEPNTFPTIIEGIWWAVVTISTVGYGDYSPTTTLGRIIGSVLILTGAGIVTSYFASISKATITTEQQLLKGTKEYTGKQHYIIVGWNERSKEIIEEIHERKHELNIVLIDSTLKEHPLPRTNIYFVHGHATVDSVLLRANVKEAALVLITTDYHQNEYQTDMFSILTLLAVKGLNPNVYCIVEILTKEQKENAIRAGADRLIETNKFASEYMLHCLLSGHKLQFQEESADFHIAKLDMKHEWVKYTFQQLSGILLEQEILLIGFIREGKKRYKPPVNIQMQAGDSLLIIVESL